MTDGIRAGFAPARIQAIRRRVVAAVFAALLSTTLLFAGGCAEGESASERAAREAAGEILSRIDEGDVETITAYLEAAWFDLSAYDVSEDDFVEVFFAPFSYELGSARDMSDGSVEVELWVTTYDGEQFENALGDAQRDAYDADATLDLSSVAANVALVESSEDNPYLLYLVEGEDGSWVVESEGSFGALLLGGYDPRQLADDF